ncbi:MAG TPA: RidA family protein [Gammaproteobacteria bacterium]|jgi:enamine deaminase RidA (YjgF/YER057c/UK114 family)|nr:RidA family protein [Gammaproteobacteria bacterium]
MPGRVDRRLEELGIIIPRAQKPRVAKIKGSAVIGTTLYISGMIPQWEGEVRYVGKVGEDFSIDEGREAARLSALNVIAQAGEALNGDLDRIRQIAKVSGFVNCAPHVTEVAAVVNGASELFMEIFGQRGAHARVAVGATTMPLGVAVEIEAIMEIE